MGKRKTGDKLGDIRRATVAEVVERGSSAASVNAIAARAGLAVGTVYRYYENKEQLLRAVYLANKTDLHDVMMQAASGANTHEDRIRAMWFAVLRYAVDAPQSFLFSEMVVNDTILTDSDRERIREMASETRTVVSEAVADGVLRSGDPQAIVTLLAASALYLGRSTALRGEPPESAHAEEIFQLCWCAIAS
ncbi:TetR/AcrR family transcriptional regulator [Jannaschia marina]|uniref:TetR/AcrR family transcriptional regulator n=1 Tax=Jannaschia marina TaxID=2741674 RepID=UPI0015C7CC8E|nr:TetR/AcrR family transcriptional regulator [Jannaschia marina]